MLIIGSYALQQYGLLDRSPSDIDLVIHYSDYLIFFNDNQRHIKKSIPVSDRRYVLYLNTSKYKFDVSLENLDSEKILLRESLNWKSVKVDGIEHYEFRLPPLDWLLAIKSSHIHCDVRGFDKNIRDYHNIRTELSSRDKLVFSDVQKEFIELRKKEAEVFHRHTTPRLNVSNEKFFERSSEMVGRDFVHDDLHEALKHNDVPVFEMLKNDTDSAYCERELFDRLSFENKVQSVLEEAYVIASERYLFKDDISPRDAFIKALRRICTTLCSGFFRSFAIDNYFDIVSGYDQGFTGKVINAYNKGEMTMLKEKSLIEQSMRIYRENSRQN